MVTLKARVDTYLKHSTKQVIDLKTNERVFIPAGMEYKLNWVKPAGSGHSEVQLTNKLFGRHNYFVFDNHVEFIQLGVNLNVPLYSQRDNIYEPNRTCNTSCCAMVAKYAGADISGDDEYYQLVRKYGDTTDHSAQTRALRELGINSEFRYNWTFKMLDDELFLGHPVVIGILHKGSYRNPSGGHMIVVRGRKADGSMYLVNDPWGDINTAYATKYHSKAGIWYHQNVLADRWTVPKDGDGWGRRLLIPPIRR